jgi:hypothetical protein
LRSGLEKGALASRKHEERKGTYRVTFHLRLERGGLLFGGVLAVVIDFGAFAERTTRGARRASDGWGGFLAEFDALNNRVRSLSKKG